MYATTESRKSNVLMVDTYVWLETTKKKEEKAYFDPRWYNLARPMKLKTKKKKLILIVVNTASHCYQFKHSSAKLPLTFIRALERQSPTSPLQVKVVKSRLTKVVLFLSSKNPYFYVTISELSQTNCNILRQRALWFENAYPKFYKKLYN